MPQPNSIRILPPQLAKRIVAGEVVERPASVVRELMENSRDAGATKVSVEIQDGGLSLIRVSDDGHGIGRDDLPLVLERFATSKIRSAQDLLTLGTLGFRGEALSDIAEAAQLEIFTRIEGEGEGTRLTVRGETVDLSPAAGPKGTSVTVRNLFYSAPARRRSLKSAVREGELVRKTVVRCALAWPEVALRLVSNDRETFVALSSSPLERLETALGRDVAAEMHEIAWQAGDLRVRGYVGGPNAGQSSRQGQYFIVNGRCVRSGLLAVMLERPYAGRLPPGRHPLAVVYIDLDPAQVDVNVHPRKVRVRFAQEQAVFQALLWAVEAALSPLPHQEQYPSLDRPFGGAQDRPFGGAQDRPFGEALRPWAGGPRAQDRPFRAFDAPYQTTGELRVMGQLRNSYLIAQGTEGLVVIDQHAAHEQVLFETLLLGDPPAELEPPFQLALTPDEAEHLAGNLILLAELGLEIEAEGKQDFVLRSLPAAVIHVSPPELIAALLQELERDWHLNEERLRERIAAKIACTAAVKAGDRLAPETMQDLVDDLLAVWSPATCPHGRPAFVTLNVEELARRFRQW
jgi:DNA mismatch repair protein MutL